MRRLAFMLLAVAAATVGCGSSDGDGDDGEAIGAPQTTADTSSGDPADSTVTEFVALSTLGLPFELGFDPPVPADSEIVNSVDQPARDGNPQAYSVSLATSATYDDVVDTYDEYFASLHLGAPAPKNPDLPDWYSWGGLNGPDSSALRLDVTPNGIAVLETFPSE